MLLVNCGWAAESIRDTKMALHYYSEAIKIGSVRDYRKRGLLKKITLNKKEEALMDFSQGLLIDPHSRLLLEGVLRVVLQKANAIKLLQKYHPIHYYSWQMDAAILADAGNYEKAHEKLNDAIEYNLNIQIKISKIINKKCDLKNLSLEEFLKFGYEVYVHNVTVSSLAEWYYLKGDFEHARTNFLKAKKFYEMSLSFDPSFTVVQAELQKLQQKIKALQKR